MMGDVLEFKRRTTFQQAAEAATSASFNVVGYHDFQSLRASGVHLMHQCRNGDLESIDFLLVQRDAQKKQGADRPEMYFSDNDYLYFVLCRDNDVLEYVGNGRVEQIPLRFDEDTFTPILRDARMQYMKRNWAAEPALSL